MKHLEIYALILCGLFYFSEGKPCPEKTRPHKTRCEAYYKCMEMPHNKHVWVPEKCEQGLIYERNLKLCVLPADDWECTLGDATTVDKISKRVTNQSHSNVESSTHGLQDTDMFIVQNGSEDMATVEHPTNDNNVELILSDCLSSSEEENDSEQIESSGGGELVELDGFLQAEVKETDDHLMDKPMEQSMPPKTSNIDPKLTEHLQRLSQLIDGLKQTYQNGGEPPKEMRPDQLNAFLAHFNIKNKFDSITPVSGEPVMSTSTTAAPDSTTTIDLLKLASKNKTLLQEHLSNKLKPETKVVLTNALPKRYANSGYSNSQIVVNRPEGSVLFTLPSAYGNEHSSHSEEYSGHSSPKISEDTLKTVLELSKQMIATQNIPKVIPNPAYYPQPIIQPLFISASAFGPQSHGSPFSGYYNQHGNNQDYEDSPISSGYQKPHHGHKKTQRPGTTIIHNNVIPVHVTSTNSGEKEIIDSYGHSVGLYPPLKLGDIGNGNGNNQVTRYENNKFVTSVTTSRPSISSTPSSNYLEQYPSPYSTEISVTTSRPFDFQPTPSTIAEFYTPSPHLNEHNVQHLYQPSERYPTIPYGSIPRPMDLKRPNFGQQQQQQQQQQHQQQGYYSLFPTQIDPNKVKIRPNAQKLESVEEETDEEIVAAYSENQSQQQQQQQQVLSYNYNNEKPDFNAQYIDPVLSFNNGHKRPYMPRPSSSLSSSIFSGNNNNNKHKYSPYPNGGHKQLVNVGGNFISFDAFQNSILPLLGNGGLSIGDLNNVEVITCATGVRQPNMTDCTRYYVCSKKDGKVLSYSCPPYTAFNAQTRICDANTYASCRSDSMIGSYAIPENKRTQLEVIKALQDAKRRQDQALKAQNIANFLQQYSNQPQQQSVNEQIDSSEKDMLNSYMQQAAAMSAFSTTARPSTAPVKKRKYYCKEGDKIADQTSIYNYFVCYKNAQGMMKGHKMTCTKGLLFCPQTKVCTFPSKCT